MATERLLRRVNILLEEAEDAIAKSDWELVRDRATRESFPSADAIGWRVCMAARDRGVFVRPLGDVVVLMPPLSIEEEELVQIAEAVQYGLCEVGSDHGAPA